LHKNKYASKWRLIKQIVWVAKIKRGIFKKILKIILQEQKMFHTFAPAFEAKMLVEGEKKR
jgi:hypothetical protein